MVYSRKLCQAGQPHILEVATHGAQNHTNFKLVDRDHYQSAYESTATRVKRQPRETDERKSER
jgi:hypothetical protein